MPVGRQTLVGLADRAGSEGGFPDDQFTHQVVGCGILGKFSRRHEKLRRRHLEADSRKIHRLLAAAAFRPHAHGEPVQIVRVPFGQFGRRTVAQRHPLLQTMAGMAVDLFGHRLLVLRLLEIIVPVTVWPNAFGNGLISIIFFIISLGIALLSPFYSKTRPAHLAPCVLRYL